MWKIKRIHFLLHGTCSTFLVWMLLLWIARAWRCKHLFYSRLPIKRRRVLAAYSAFAPGGHERTEAAEEKKRTERKCGECRRGKPLQRAIMEWLCFVSAACAMHSARMTNGPLSTSMWVALFTRPTCVGELLGHFHKEHYMHIPTSDGEVGPWDSVKLKLHRALTERDTLVPSVRSEW